jgi:hydrogenase expression/formation protein HypC
MCLAVPLEISRVLDEERALVKQGRGEMEINISLLQEPKPGDFVIVHAGFGIEKLDLQEAEVRLAMFREIDEGSRRLEEQTHKDQEGA